MEFVFECKVEDVVLEIQSLGFLLIDGKDVLFILRAVRCQSWFISRGVSYSMRDTPSAGVVVMAMIARHRRGPSDSIVPQKFFHRSASSSIRC